MHTTNGRNKVPLLNSRGDWAVDVFIIMSFLWRFHYYREQIEPLPQTWTVFWFRRSWRLTPALLRPASGRGNVEQLSRSMSAEHCWKFSPKLQQMGRWYSPTGQLTWLDTCIVFFWCFPQFAFRNSIA
jgi:hypothetical protein